MPAIILPFAPISAGSPTIPVSGSSQWLTAVGPYISGALGGLTVADPVTSKGTINKPELIGLLKVVFRRVNDSGHLVGTSLRLRVCYPTLPQNADTWPVGIVHPVLRVFGARAQNPAVDPPRDTYAALRNSAGDCSAVFKLDPWDDAVGTIETEQSTVEAHATTPRNAEHTWDCDGCTHFVVGVERALSTAGVSGYVASAAFVQAKIV